MIPPRPSSGLFVPGGGASPNMPSNGLDGPSRCIHDSAVTWGATISGSSNRNPASLRPAMSLIDTKSANGTPISSASTAPKNAVSTVLSVAFSVDALAARSRKMEGSNTPPGASAAQISRSTGSRHSPPMTTKMKMTGNAVPVIQPADTPILPERER